jgi:hypothetical protein
MTRHTCSWRRFARLAGGLAAAWLLTAGVLAAPVVSAQRSLMDLSIFDDADLALGHRLIEEHACEECHARNKGGDGRTIYQPTGRISSPGALRGMVEYCNTQLNLGLFPEEVTSVAAVLQRDHYRFGRTTPAPLPSPAPVSAPASAPVKSR